MRRTTMDREQGAVAVTVAIVLVVLFMVAGLVVDLGLKMMDVRANQRSSDLAVVAGAMSLDPVQPNGYRDACEQAWDYVLANAPEVDPTAASPCATFDDAVFTCDGTTPVEATGPTGPYTVTVTMPVPDNHALMGGQDINATVDGPDPCDRIGLTVTRAREYLFARVGGFTSGSALADAVARRMGQGDTSEFASLVVLDRAECGALHSDGKGRITVESATSSTGKVFEGFITVDSAATGGQCSTTTGTRDEKAVDVTNNNSCSVTPCGIFASGEIFSYAKQVGNTATAYDPCDVDDGGGTSCNGKPVLLDPIPIAGSQVTRSIIDHRYNCLDPYPAYHPTNGPQYPVEAIDPCPGGGSSAHVDALVAAYGGSGAPAGFTDAVTTYPELADCTIEGAGEPEVRVTDSHVYVDCDPLFVKNILVLEDVEAAVFRGGIVLESGGTIISNEDAARDHVLYVRSGGIHRAGTATMDVRRGMVYVHDPAGTITTAGGSGGGISLVAPVGPQDDPACNYPSGSPPPAQCLEDLAVWSNGSTDHDLSGNGSLDVHGTVFTPNSGRSGTYFTLRGQGNQTLDHAQFVAHRIFVTGQGVITMRPDPDRITPFRATGAVLIR